MKILHILDHSIPLHSGYTFRTRAILEQQRALGWQTFQVTGPKHKSVTEFESNIDGFDFYRTPQSMNLLTKVPVLNQLGVISALTKRLRRIVPQLRPDILHAHSPALNGVAALRVARQFGTPLVYEVRAFWEDAAVDHGTCREGDMRYRLTRALETHVLKQVDAITTICEGLRNDIIMRGIPAERITVIPNAVDIERFDVNGSADQTLLGELGLKDKSIIGFIGSFYAYEGLRLLLQAMPKILETLPSARILLVGGGPQENELRQLATTLGLSDKVIFVGRVPHHQIQRYYNLIDVFVYPRLSMRLTDIVTPLKPLEAMAQGRLVIASDVGGHRELIHDGQTGLLFRAGDSTALAVSVVELLKNPDRWPRLRSAGRRFVEQERNWKSIVARYGPIYESLLRAGYG